jgi:CubicO group peptidase (beta-lactamase class C family)
VRFAAATFLFVLALPAVSASAQVVGLTQSSPAEAHLDPKMLSTMEQAVRHGDFPKVSSVVILRNGKLAYETYFEGDANTLRDTRSATKTITSALVGMAIQQHHIDSIQTPILPFFPGYQPQNPDPRKAKITVEDLLTMSSPLECDDDNEFSRGNEERMYALEDWSHFFLDLPMGGQMRLPGATPPKYGRRFSYCTAGVFTLSPILQQATGQAVDVYARQNLFAPLGIENAAWVYSPLGLVQTGGGLRLSSRDLAKFAQLYLNDGTWNGKRLLASDWIKQSTTPHVEADADEATEYGYLWWLKTFKSKDGKLYPSFWMSGNGGNKVVAIPSLNAVIVITSTNYNSRGMHQSTEKLLDEFILPAFH